MSGAVVASLAWWASRRLGSRGALSMRSTVRAAALNSGLASKAPDEEILCLRPLSGSEADVQLADPAREPVPHAHFKNARSKALPPPEH